jgi:hypothetical protein
MGLIGQISIARANTPLEQYYDVDDLSFIMQNEVVPGDHVTLHPGDFRGEVFQVPDEVYLTILPGAVVEYAPGFRAQDFRQTGDVIDNTSSPLPVNARYPEIGGNVENVIDMNLASEWAFEEDLETLRDTVTSLTTDDVPEGSGNLYYTSDRVDDLLFGGDGIDLTFTDGGDGDTSSKTGILNDVLTVTHYTPSTVAADTTNATGVTTDSGQGDVQEVVQNLTFDQFGHVTSINSTTVNTYDYWAFTFENPDEPSWSDDPTSEIVREFETLTFAGRANQRITRSGRTLNIWSPVYGDGLSFDPTDTTGGRLDHADTSSENSTNNVATEKLVQNIDLDVFGHVTNIESVDIGSVLYDGWNIQKVDAGGNPVAGEGGLITANAVVEFQAAGDAVVNISSLGGNDRRVEIDVSAADAFAEGTGITLTTPVGGGQTTVAHQDTSSATGETNITIAGSGPFNANDPTTVVTAVSLDGLGHVDAIAPTTIGPGSDSTLSVTGSPGSTDDTAGSVDIQHDVSGASDVSLSGTSVLSGLTFDSASNGHVTGTSTRDIVGSGSINVTESGGNIEVSLAGSLYELGFAGDSGSGTITNAETFNVLGGTAISTNASGNDLTISNQGVTSLSGGTDINVSSSTGGVTVNHANTGSSFTLSGDGDTFIQDVTTDSNGHITAVSLGNVNFPSVNTYDGWNVAADSGGSTFIDENETVTIAGGSGVSTSRSGNTITITGGSGSTVSGISYDEDTGSFSLNQSGASNLSTNIRPERLWSNDSTPALEVVNDPIPPTSPPTDNGDHIRIFGDLSVAGSIDAGGDVVANYTSDINLKDHVTPLENAGELVDKLSGNEFQWNEKQRDHRVGNWEYGVIAQEVQDVLPHAVKERKNGVLAVDYKQITPLLIEAVKEQRREIADLKTALREHGIEV